MCGNTFPVWQHFLGKNAPSCWGNPTTCSGNATSSGGKAHSCGGTHLFLGETQLPMIEHIFPWRKFTFQCCKFIFLWGNISSCVDIILSVREKQLFFWETHFIVGNAASSTEKGPYCEGTHLLTREQNFLLGNDLPMVKCTFFGGKLTFLCRNCSFCGWTHPPTEKIHVPERERMFLQQKLTFLWGNLHFYEGTLISVGNIHLLLG